MIIAQRRFFLSLMLLTVCVAQAKVTEFKSDEDARVFLNNAKKPVVIDFYATWCPPCKMMVPIFEDASDELKNDFLFAKANGEDLQELARELGVQAFPTFIIVKDGNKIGKVVGYKAKDDFISALKDAAHPQDLSKLDKKELGKKLQEALHMGSVQEVRDLIDAGVDVDALLENGMKPIVWAMIWAQSAPEQGLPKIQLLLDAGVALTVDVPGQGEMDLKEWAIKSQEETKKMFEKMLESQKKVIRMLEKHYKKNKKANSSAADKEMVSL